jgi:SAM-dependent methyltransferase
MIFFRNCPACGELLVVGVRPWHLTCQNCSYEGSTLESRIIEQTEGGDLDESAREHALETLRQRNFSTIADEISRITRRDATSIRQRLLDVGCAHGWFMQACASRFDVLGIEPDEAVARAAAARVSPIRHGFFPDVLTKEEKFDVIVFNDVLEHIPDITSTLRACSIHLTERGVLVINAPSRLGAIYRLAKFLTRLGWPGSFDRMWQVGFPSPHVHYLDTESISRLAKTGKFEMIGRSRLPSVTIQGLYSRIRYSKEVSPLRATFIALAVMLSIPVLSLLPPDIEVWYLRKI